MIKIENVDAYGFETAIRGMRNPMNSWNKSDTEIVTQTYYALKAKTYSVEIANVGENDLALMKKLVKAGTDHRKFMRFITVTCDITAPLYWWKEYDTYKVGTVANSCSTMHTICNKEFALDDFSHEHLIDYCLYSCDEVDVPIIDGAPHVRCGGLQLLCLTINTLNYYRRKYLETNDKKYWWQIIQLLPSSYNQRRTVLLNYEVLLNMYHARKNHKLDEWRDFCGWVESLPYMGVFLNA